MNSRTMLIDNRAGAQTRNGSQIGAQKQNVKPIGALRFWSYFLVPRPEGKSPESDAKMALWELRYAKTLSDKGKCEKAAVHLSIAAGLTSDKLEAAKLYLEAGKNLEWAAGNFLIRTPPENRNAPEVRAQMVAFYTRVIEQYNLTKTRLTDASLHPSHAQYLEIHKLLPDIAVRITEAENIQWSFQ
jgi:hypothetical protein